MWAARSGADGFAAGHPEGLTGDGAGCGAHERGDDTGHVERRGERAEGCALEQTIRERLALGVELALCSGIDHAPRRRQPALSWLALGAGIAVVLSMVAAAGLAGYVHLSSSFGSTYGPLAGIVALLTWSLMSSVSVFYGVAVCAQLEALRAHQEEPAYDDPGRPHEHPVDG